MNNMKYEEIKKKYLDNNYVFRTGLYEINVFGIRSVNSQSNQFDDIIGVAWKGKKGTYCLTGAATTDPGKYYLQNPMNKNGTIIMVPGQYLNCYHIGLHAGKYDCFKQVGPMGYVRDNNKDTVLDFKLYRYPDLKKIHYFEGINGTNLHRASEWKIIQLVERYSAGCQVVQDPTFYSRLLSVRDVAINNGQVLFDYTLFE